MRHLLTIFFSVILTLITMHFLYPIKNAARAEKDVYQKIMDKGVLRCGYASWEPMLIIDPNTKKLSGIAHDVIEEAGKKMGIKIEWTEETGWADFPQAVSTGRIDAFCAGNWLNSERGRIADFTAPFAYSPLNVYVRADDTRFDNGVDVLNDPQMKTVYVEGGAEGGVVLNRFPKGSHYTVSQLAPTASIFIEVTGQKADATVCDPATGDLYIKNNPGKIKRAPGDALMVFPHVFTIKKGEYALQQAINTALVEMQNEGVIEGILMKYEPLPHSYYRINPGYTK